MANDSKEANFKKMKKFSKNPTLGAYLNSVVNLGLFVTEAERPDSDCEGMGEDFTFDDIGFSSLGLDLANRFDKNAGSLSAAKHIVSKDRCCSVDDLADFKKYGGLCELSDNGSAGRPNPPFIRLSAKRCHLIGQQRAEVWNRPIAKQRRPGARQAWIGNAFPICCQPA